MVLDIEERVVMKHSGFQKTGLALAVAFLAAISTSNGYGQETPTPMLSDVPAQTNGPAATSTDSTPPPVEPNTPPATATDTTPPPIVPDTPAAAAPYISPATSQILHLTQAKVSDSTIIAYVQNSSTMYGLNADQIIYLKQQGVSDGVLNAMLNQSSKVAAEVAAQTPPPNYGQGTPPEQSSTAVVQPTTAAPSAVYTVPDSQTANYNAWASQYSYPYYYPYYAYYPYYYPYYYWPVTFSFYYGYPWYGWGWHGGYWHGGTWVGGSWHGGTWGGTGWHGGGTWSGGGSSWHGGTTAGGSGWHGGTGTSMGGGGFHGGMGGGGGFHH
jgi:hypothetical protein